MKRLKNVIGSYGLAVMGLVLTVLLFTACKKEKIDQMNSPVAGVMAFNLAVDKPAVGFALSGGTTLGNVALNYTGYSGTYLPVYPGTRELRAFEYYMGTTIASTSATFVDSAYYSAFLMGATGNYRTVVVRDDMETPVPVAGKAWVRYVNAIPDSVSTVSVTVGSNTQTAAYTTVSGFTQVNAGAVTISVSNGSSINASRTINMDENKVYTVLLSGLPNPTDPEKVVQIRFIQNGTATQE